MTKNDYVIICGDFGVVWGDGKQDEYLQQWYNEKPWTTLFVDGNHENHDLLAQYPVEMWDGGKVHRINDSVIHLMRGQYYNIDGRTFWTMGGANSHDKQYRTEGKSWWANEVPSLDEWEEGFKNLEDHNWTVDYILTHDMPTRLAARIYESINNDRVEDLLGNVYALTDFKHWYCGHHHFDYDFNDEKISVMYHRTIELDGEKNEG